MSAFFNFKRPQAPPKRAREAGSKTQVLSDKENSLFVFGYACKIFDDKEKALYFDQGKHLIPWPGDESLVIDRYDARLCFTDQSQFVHTPDYEHKPTPEETEIERLCDEERYMEMSKDMTEHEIEQEEEMKRFQEVMAEDGYYNSVSFSYQVNSCPDHNQWQPEQNAQTVSEVVNEAVPVSHQSSSSVAYTHSAEQETQPEEECEVFVPPAELEVPSNMEIPQTTKMHSIIAKTALFLSKHGAQMEIVVKAKQSGNPQFDFLSFGNWLNPYYRHMLSYIKEGKYIPETEPSSSISPTPEKQEKPEESSDSEDDSDGEYDLHPLLTASLNSKPTKPRVQPVAMQPLPSSFRPTFRPETHQEATELNQEMHGHWPENEDSAQQHMWNSHNGISMAGEADYVVSMSFTASSLYDPYSAYMHMTYTTAPMNMSATQTAASMLPPPPPPPGEGPPEELGEISSVGVLPMPPPPPPPSLPLCPPILIEQERAAIIPTASSSTLFPESAPQLVQAAIVPPPPDLQPIVDKLANYVARNGEDFESTVKAKNDARFEFLNPWNAHYSYYQYKKQLCQQQLKKKSSSAGASDSATDSPKGPISFSLKTKDSKKPKIEYRTNVIYKQSVGESDEEEEDEVGDRKENNEKPADSSLLAVGNGSQSNKDQLSNKQLTTEERVIEEQQNLDNQMKSIAAAQREAKRLEMESLKSGMNETEDEVGSFRTETDQEKQIQLERRRRASLFISMLKNPSGNGNQEAAPPINVKSFQESPATTKVRTFSEIKRKVVNSSGAEPVEAKKPRSSSPIFDIEEDSPSGVGAPSADSIKLTKDLMVKVLAARDKR